MNVNIRPYRVTKNKRSSPADCSTIVSLHIVYFVYTSSSHGLRLSYTE